MRWPMVFFAFPEPKHLQLSAGRNSTACGSAIFERFEPSLSRLIGIPTVTIQIASHLPLFFFFFFFFAFTTVVCSPLI